MNNLKGETINKETWLIKIRQKVLLPIMILGIIATIALGTSNLISDLIIDEGETESKIAWDIIGNTAGPYSLTIMLAIGVIFYRKNKLEIAGVITLIGGEAVVFLNYFMSNPIELESELAHLSLLLILYIVMASILVHKRASYILASFNALITIIAVMVIAGEEYMKFMKLIPIHLIAFMLTAIISNIFTGNFYKLLSLVDKESVQNLNNYSKLRKIFNKIDLLREKSMTKSKVISSIIDKLEESMKFVINNIEIVEVKAISMNEIMEKTDSHLSKLKNSINDTLGSINIQTSTANENSNYVIQLSESLNLIGNTIIDTSKVGSELSKSTKSSGKNILSAIETIKNMETFQKKINDIASLISGIAEQTNMLAMNASIEAAHAGKFGAGFAVVASEIHSLADKSSQQTKVIISILKKMSSEIESSTKKSEIAINSIGIVENNIEKMNDAMTSIKGATEEQQTLIKNVLSSVDLLNESTKSIKEESSKQDKISIEFIDSFDALKKLLKDVYNLIKGLEKTKEETISEISDIKTIENENKAINDSINNLIDDSDGDKA